MNMIDWFKHVVVDNYANFKGRARRAEFWYFNLASALLSLVITLIGTLLFADTAQVGVEAGPGLSGTDPLSSLYSLAVFVPSLAVGTRRLHDTGRSGWWQLLAFTCIGIIPLIYWFASAGTPGPNAHGTDPKAADVDSPADHLI